LRLLSKPTLPIVVDHTAFAHRLRGATTARAEHTLLLLA
jgi:hypothetical protein